MTDLEDCDEAGDYAVPNVLSPRDLVSRPDNMDETVLPHTLKNSDNSYHGIVRTLPMLFLVIYDMPGLNHLYMKGSNKFHYKYKIAAKCSKK